MSSEDESANPTLPIFDQSFTNLLNQRQSSTNMPIQYQPFTNQLPKPPIHCQSGTNLPIDYQSRTKRPKHTSVSANHHKLDWHWIGSASAGIGTEHANPTPIGGQSRGRQGNKSTVRGPTEVSPRRTITHADVNMSHSTDTRSIFQSNANPGPIYQSIINPTILCRSLTNRPIHYQTPLPISLKSLINLKISDKSTNNQTIQCQSLTNPSIHETSFTNVAIRTTPSSHLCAANNRNWIATNWQPIGTHWQM